MKRLLLLLLTGFLISCGNSKNSPEFINSVSGEYLFNSKETIGISFVEDEMMVSWRGKDNIKPLKLNDSAFYMKEMNEKLIFISSPVVMIELAQKREHEGNTIRFTKMKTGDKTPSEYFENEEFDKALEGYLTIQKNNPSSRSVSERDINSIGYRAIRDKEYQKAIEIFKLNVTLYPESANVYDSLGDAYWQVRDSVNALENFKKVLTLDPDNERAQRFVKDYIL